MARPKQIQAQGQAQNVRVTINLAEKKKKRKPRRKRIREPPTGKSSFQQIMRDNQAPQVVVRRIYDQSPYLDELNRVRTAQQATLNMPISAPVIGNIPLASQAERRGSITAKLDAINKAKRDNMLRGIQQENTEAVVVNAGERQEIPTNPNTSTLTGTPEPPTSNTIGTQTDPKQRKKRSDAGKKRDLFGALTPLSPASGNAVNELQRNRSYDAGSDSESGRRSGYSMRAGGGSAIRSSRASGSGMSDSERQAVSDATTRRQAQQEFAFTGTSTRGI